MHARSRSRIAALAISCFLLPAVLSACGSSASEEETKAQNPEIFERLPEAIKKSKQIKVGVSRNTPPILLIDGAQEFGIIPDLAKQVEKILGVELKLVPMDYPGLQPALMSKRVDVSWSVLDDTPDAQKQMDFVDFMRADHGFLVRKGNPLGINGADDLCGTRTATVQGGLDVPFLKDVKKKCEAEGKTLDVRLYKSRADIQTAIQSGKVDSFMGMTPAHEYQAKTVKDGTLFDVTPGSYLNGFFGAVFSKDSTALRDTFQAALKQAVKDGTYIEVFRKHGIEKYALTEDQIMVNGVGNGL